MAPTKPGTKPGTKTPPPRPGPGQPSKPVRFPDPFKTPWENPGTKEKPKACGPARRSESVRLKAAQVVDNLLEVKMYSQRDPDIGGKPAPSGRVASAARHRHWEKMCPKCGQPHSSAHQYCPTCLPKAASTGSSSMPGPSAR